jgi:L-rhamnose mutarotase
MPLKCFMLDLKDDPELIAEYVHWHRPGGPPTAVTESIRAQGVEEMLIFLSGNRLCMVVDADENFGAASKRAGEAINADVIGWEERMSEFQQTLPWAKPGEKWVECAPIYALSEQPG